MPAEQVQLLTESLQRKRAALGSIQPVRSVGQVKEVVGILVESQGPIVSLGDLCEVFTRDGRIRTEVIGFRDGRVLSMPLDAVDGIELGLPVVARREAAKCPTGSQLLGRVIDPFGNPLDDLGTLGANGSRDVYAVAPGPMDRQPIHEPLQTGIRVIDGLLTCGRGQRVGIFGGSGVGKSTLLGAMAANTDADIIVIALVGERNREVRAFLEETLGEQGLDRSVVVVATSDQPAPLRVRAPFVATSIAESFRDQGKNVLLIMDSVTRLAMAQREIGLAAGEPPSQKGYTPSVFQRLPQLFERAGNFESGSITGFYTVLVEGDDMMDPIADAVRSILDGHIVLSRDLAASNHYPAVDALESVSRLVQSVTDENHRNAAARLRDAMAAYRRAEDLINLGAYAKGSNAEVDRAIEHRDDIQQFLRQDLAGEQPYDDTRSQLAKLAEAL